ncbi:nicotinamide-nucleotide amidohydrolase family protein [Ornithinimicrobium sp. Arc0846-15]|nr:nicotinamide-nucleotide amidohydrolase family protein [Ornithinimicrobium laminariae]
MGSEEVTGEDLVAALSERGHTIAVAESLTGGLLASAIVDVAGASQVFQAGIVAYQDELKADLLGVDRALLAQYGAVSEQVAEAMAIGARSRAGADWAIATTGVAGPEPSEGKPVGTVCLAVAQMSAQSGEEVTHSTVLHIQGSRSAIRSQSVTAALALALGAIVDPHRPITDARGTV